MATVAGIVLIVAAVALAAKIFTAGGPIVPHIVGPIALALLGVILLIR